MFLISQQTFHCSLDYVLHLLFLFYVLINLLVFLLVPSWLNIQCSSFNVPNLILTFLFLTHPTFELLYCSFFKPIMFIVFFINLVPKILNFLTYLTYLKLFLSPYLMREGVQSSSNSNHRHPNLFRGKRAPQLVISTTSKLNCLFLRNKTILTSFNGPMVYNIVKAFFIAP